MIVPDFLAAPSSAEARAALADLAGLCALAYEKPATIKAALPGREWVNHKRSDTQLYVVNRRVLGVDCRVVVFRGTQVSAGWSWTDILRNFRLGFMDWPHGGRVHSGYGKAILAVDGALTDLLLLRGAKPVVVTGHSLGGALATLALDLPGMGAAIGVTFGAPAVGDAAFNARIQDRLIRVVVHRDIAPKHPRRWLGYRQPPEYIRLEHDGRARPARWGWADNLYIPFTSRGALHGKADHRVGVYRALAGPPDD
jgi:hypothetical protein